MADSNLNVFDRKVEAYRNLGLHDNGDGTFSPQVSASFAASENHLGEVGGNSAIITPTLVVATTAYASGNIVGGALTLTNALRKSGGSGVLQSLLLIDKSNQKLPLNIYLFNQAPVGTYTDRAALSWDSRDIPNIIRRIAVVAGDYVTDGGVAVADLSPGGRILQAVGTANLYALIVAQGAATFAATGDLILRVGLLRD